MCAAYAGWGSAKRAARPHVEFGMAGAEQVDDAGRLSHTIEVRLSRIWHGPAPSGMEEGRMSQRLARTAALRWGVWYGALIGVLGVIQITPGLLAVAANSDTLSAYRRECAGGDIFAPCA